MNGKMKYAAVLAAILLVACMLACGQAEPVSAPEATAAPQTMEAVSMTTTTPAPTPEPTATPTPAPQNRSQTSGRVIPEGTPSRPVMVSIENANGAKPQTALMQADIVYELLVESMITRFHVVYNDSYPAFVGPVRSSRYYFVDLAQEWDCMYLHLGYGPWSGKYYYSIREIAKKVGVYPRNNEKQFYGYSAEFSPSKGGYLETERNNGYRFRDPQRDAPHNLFLCVYRMADRYFGDYVATPYERFRFMENVSYNDGESFFTVTLSFTNEDNPTWIQFKYDPATNRLYRYENGQKFMTVSLSDDGLTKTDEQMNVQNLIVQYAAHGRIPDDEKSRRTIDLVGSGKCDYFINGQHVTGTWTRPTLADKTTYLYADGSTVILEPGNTWIAVHPDSAPAVVE